MQGYVIPVFTQYSSNGLVGLSCACKVLTTSVGCNPNASCPSTDFRYGEIWINERIGLNDCNYSNFYYTILTEDDNDFTSLSSLIDSSGLNLLLVIQSENGISFDFHDAFLQRLIDSVLSEPSWKLRNLTMEIVFTQSNSYPTKELQIMLKLRKGNLKGDSRDLVVTYMKQITIFIDYKLGINTDNISFDHWCMLETGFIRLLTEYLSTAFTDKLEYYFPMIFCPGTYDEFWSAKPYLEIIGNTLHDHDSLVAKIQTDLAPNQESLTEVISLRDFIDRHRDEQLMRRLIRVSHSRKCTNTNQPAKPLNPQKRIKYFHENEGEEGKITDYSGDFFDSVNHEYPLLSIFDL